MVRCEKCFESYDDRIAAGVCPHCGYYTGEPQADPRYLPIGFVLHDRYVIGGVIGVGGFGITYKAWDRKYGVCKAVKEYFQQGVVNRVPGEAQVFVSSERQREEFLYGKERLINEARIVAKFQSSSIVRVEDYFEENGTSYMVMEYLHYKTLQDFVIDRKRLLDPDEAILVPGCHCHKIQRDRTRKTVTVLVVGVVAAKLCAARGRIDLHLPPRPIVKLKLLEGRTITAALAGQDLFAAAVERGQRGVPPPCCDLFSELPAGCHPEPLPALSAMFGLLPLL